jgi:F-type H+-transporting ATPase subunit b
MRIDWWTLALQTANVLILIWLLAKFLFRPVKEIVDRRQDEANKLLADAADARRHAEEVRAEVERAHAGIVADHNKMIAAAHAAAETERTALLAKTIDEMTKLRAETDAAIARDRLAIEKTLIDRVRDLAIEIARRLLGRVGPAAGFDAFLAGLCQQIKALPPRERGAFALTPEGEGLEIITAAPLDPEAAERVRHAVGEALGGTPVLTFRNDPAVIAGIELRGRHAVVCNSWRNDLECIREELNRGDESEKQPR